MREGWVEAKLSDLVEKIGMGPFGSNIKVSTFVAEGVPIISGAHLIKPILTEDKFNFLTEEHADRLKGSNVQRGDLVLTHAGTVGQVSLIPENSKYERYVVSQRGFYVRPKKSLTDASYLLLFLKYGDGQVQLLSNINRTGVPSLSQPVTFTKQIKVTLPPVAEQKRIVDVVSSVDAYIDALQQQVDTARTARNAVLHDLLTAGGDDWTETTLGDIAQLISRGRAPSYCEDGGVVVLNQKCIRNGRIHFEFARRTDTTKKAVPEWAYLKVGDSLINSTGVGTLGRASFVSQIDSPTTFDSHVTLVRPRPESCFASFIGLSLNFRENEIEMFAGGSTGQTELSREAVNSFPVTLPPIAEQKRIVEIVSSMDDVVQATESAVVEAKNLRSGLLSDLLSGEHEIPVSYDELLGAA